MHGTAISGGGLKGFSPKIGSLQILETTKSTLLLQAKINITNPTDYSANVPFVNINLLSNGTLLGYATAKNITVVPGLNDDILVEALWDPLTPSGKAGVDQGRELLSQYISGNVATSDLLLNEHQLTQLRRVQHYPYTQDT